MPNDRLRSALLERGITELQLAEALDVDPKTVERWISTGRTPYRRHRYAVAAHLRVDEAHRWAVPSDLWRNFFDNAERDIGVLVYSGLFLAEDAGILRVLRKKAGAGATVRIMLGDPGGEDPQRPRPVPAAARHRRRRVPAASHGPVQLDLPCRRPVDGQLAHLQLPGLAGPGPASATRRGRRHGHDVPGKLRQRVGRCAPAGMR